MLTHIVVWKYKAEVTEEERQEHVSLLSKLPDVIPEIVSFNLGFDVLRLPRSYDLGLVAVFRDRDGLDAYTVHAEHVVAANYGRHVSEHIASVDFVDE